MKNLENRNFLPPSIIAQQAIFPAVIEIADALQVFIDRMIERGILEWGSIELDAANKGYRIQWSFHANWREFGDHPALRLLEAGFSISMQPETWFDNMSIATDKAVELEATIFGNTKNFKFDVPTVDRIADRVHIWQDANLKVINKALALI